MSEVALARLTPEVEPRAEMLLIEMLPALRIRPEIT
jgi:hypothetical protein